MLKAKNKERRDELIKWFNSIKDKKSNWDYQNRIDIVERFNELMSIGLSLAQYRTIRNQRVTFPEFDLSIAEYWQNVYDR